jgi:hypothetical protein
MFRTENRTNMFFLGTPQKLIKTTIQNINMVSATETFPNTFFHLSSFKMPPALQCKTGSRNRVK